MESCFQARMATDVPIPPATLYLHTVTESQLFRQAHVLSNPIPAPTISYAHSAVSLTLPYPLPNKSGWLATCRPVAALTAVGLVLALGVTGCRAFCKHCRLANAHPCAGRPAINEETYWPTHWWAQAGRNGRSGAMWPSLHRAL